MLFVGVDDVVFIVLLVMVVVAAVIGAARIMVGVQVTMENLLVGSKAVEIIRKGQENNHDNDDEDDYFA